MSKQESIKIMRILRVYYPAYFKTRKKEELDDFIKTFITEFEDFDYNLAYKSIFSLAKDRFKNGNKYCPNIIEMKNSIINSMISLILEVLDMMKEEGYFKIGINGTGRDAELKEFYRYDNVLESLEKGHLTYSIRKEIEYRMDNMEEYKKYKGILLLQYLWKRLVASVVKYTTLIRYAKDNITRN